MDFHPIFHKSICLYLLMVKVEQNFYTASIARKDLLENLPVFKNIFSKYINIAGIASK